MPIEYLEIQHALDDAMVERARAEVLAAAGGDAGVTGAGNEDRVASHARRATRAEVSDGTRDAVLGLLEGHRSAIEERFGRHVDACEEPQFLRYVAGDYFVPHQDGNTPLIHDHTRFRKVSAVLLLSEQSEEPRAGTYGGGSLVLHAPYTEADGRVELAPAPGTLVAFPAETTHEVTPVEHGERLSIVAWFRSEDGGGWSGCETAAAGPTTGPAVPRLPQPGVSIQR